MRIAIFALLVVGLVTWSGCADDALDDTSSAPLPGGDSATTLDPPSVDVPATGTPETNVPNGRSTPTSPLPSSPSTTPDTIPRSDTAQSDPSAATTDPENTGINERDAGESAKPLPTDQSNASRDVDVTAEIRRRITDTEGMSINARNVKIIVEEGKVTLRGPVTSAAEKETIDKIAREVAADELTVDNQIDVAQER